MSAVGDERRIGHLKATVSQTERAVITRAAILWQALHKAGHDINPSTLGEALTSICAEWTATKVDEISGK